MGLPLVDLKRVEEAFEAVKGNVGERKTPEMARRLIEAFIDSEVGQELFGSCMGVMLAEPDRARHNLGALLIYGFMVGLEYAKLEAQGGEGGESESGSQRGSQGGAGGYSN